MKKSILILLSFPFVLLNAQVTNTTSAGDWDDSGKWNNGVPVFNGTSTVNHSIVINQDIIIEGSCTANIPMIDDAGGDKYKAEIKNFGSFIINDEVTFEDEVKFLNSSSGSVNSCAVFTVGNLLIDNNSTFTISACSKIVVNGDLTIKNDIGIICDGEIEVNGNVYASNNATITGSGSLTATGNVDIADNATIFGATTPCGSPPCLFSVPLPIKLLSFDAVLNGGVVQLKWITSTEINNDYFTIERSTDAKEWNEVLVADGAGNSNQTIEYFELDYEPLEGVSYYRLRQTDYDGEQSFSGIVVVKNNQLIDDGFNLYPNPVTHNSDVKIKFENIFENEILVVLRDSKGREFYSKVLINVIAGQLIALPIDNNIPDGLYLVTATSQDKIYSKKLLINSFNPLANK